MPQATLFPDPGQAPSDGLVGYGAELTPPLLLDAYARGIFPWFNDDREPVLWWSPDPRAVMVPSAMHVSRSLAKRLRSGSYRVSADQAFADVMAGCAAPRPKQAGTWITPRMQAAYGELHEQGFAHSLEVWRDEELVGGIYGISLGRMFFGESMFSVARDASKVALATLTRLLATWQFTLLDCQIMNDHLRSLGAVAMPRRRFLALVAANNDYPTARVRWNLDTARHPADDLPTPNSVKSG